MAVIGAAAAAAGGLYYYYTKSTSSKAMVTNDVITNQKADWEKFHLQSLQYNEDDDDDDDDNDDDDDTDNGDDDDEEEEDKEGEGELSDEDIIAGKELVTEEQEDEEEEDEPTTCTICLINRQGPCRSPWKKFERCIKHQLPSSSSSEDDEQNKKRCDPYFLPWLECFSQHRLTYSVLTNQSIQPEMDFLEETHGVQISFPQHLVPTLLLPTNGDEDEEEMEEEEEELVHDELSSTVYQKKLLAIPLINPSTGNAIYVAYVRDEEKGNVLGFDYFTSELEQLLQQQQQTEGEEKEETTSESPTIITTGELMFHVPVGTTSVAVHALYKNNKLPKKDDEVKEDDTSSKSHPKKETDTIEDSISEKVYIQTFLLDDN